MQFYIFLCLLSERQNNQNLIVTSRKELSKLTFIHESSIQRRLKKLKENSLIEQRTYNKKREIEILSSALPIGKYHFGEINEKCSICKRKSKRIIEIIDNQIEFSQTTCFLYKNRKCMIEGIDRIFNKRWKNKIKDEIKIDIIVIENFQEDATYIKDGKQKRKPIGLSLRYNVLNRDGFQCVLCGASGKEAKLEIDHKIPISVGGKNEIDNLQTLCFDCNRGKSDKV